ncbi:helix-turn-helix transcriptional regulator [Streptomyces venezuelae]|uniref:Helix-turn-helix transcriptional regulator n=1 Tax=Streptomyces venezuelae TaxID=54571 RepID=A0A5P2BZS7_STRVZ|nr:LuxR family transcriptional regulator [Streptomyces venezuelae]QES35158.1 helix-turn-helix transcriptional regulator [Streptomyces venezuelae]
MPVEHIPHGAEDLCEPGAAVYARALREGRVSGSDAEPAPCLIDFGLLHPGPDDMTWLHPTAPAAALPMLLRPIEDRLARHRRREDDLTTLFESFMELGGASPPDEESPALSVLLGGPRIQAALEHAVGEADHEVLIIQPGGERPPEALVHIGNRQQIILSRGVRLRMLRVHTAQQSSAELAYLARLTGDIEARTLEEVTERAFVFDRTTAFLAAGTGDSIALELHHPALVEYFATTFWRLWRLAKPLWPRAAPQPSDTGVPARQRAIAGYLVEGLTDAEIAERLGMNIRTARVHIARLAATLGSHSRAQLGYLIGRSGILDQAH